MMDKFDSEKQVRLGQKQKNIDYYDQFVLSFDYNLINNT